MKCFRTTSPDSEWSEVNRHAAEKPVKVSPELFQLLSACVEYSRESEGAFDISVGPLMKVWGFYKGSGHLPHRPEVPAALAKVGYRHIQLDAAARTVWFDRPGVELDPGGIGKGYAVDRMVEILRRNGVSTALVAGSGSSIYGMGAPPMSQRLADRRYETRRINQQDSGGSFSQGYVDVDFRQLRKVFPGGGTHLRPHHGPADRISGAG